MLIRDRAYSGMLPGVVSGHYSEKEIHIDLVPLCKFAGARFICVAAYDIDPVMQVVKCKGRADFNYDLLSIDIGTFSYTHLTLPKTYSVYISLASGSLINKIRSTSIIHHKST